MLISMHLIVLMLLILAISRPVLQRTVQEVLLHAKNVIIALDVSYSMRATDIRPTRYIFAKKVIKQILINNPEDNIMLIAFTSNPLLLSPPTTDHVLIGIALDSLNPEFVLTKGTSLKNLFAKLASMNTGHKNLILITDGGEENELEELASLVREADVSLSILALGTTTGTSIKKADGTVLKDKEGNLVISRINPLLESLVLSVEGASYITASNAALATANALSLAINTQQDQEVQKLQKHYVELYQVPLFLALLLFLVLHTSVRKYLFLLFVLLGIQIQASTFDNYYLSQAYAHYAKADYPATFEALKQIKNPSLQSQMAKASTYYKQNNFQKAISVYKSIRSSSVKIKQKLYYNIANAYAMQKAYSKAKIYYTKTLQLGIDADAKYNLSLIALLANHKDAGAGIAHPKSQDSSNSKSESQDKKEARSEDKPSAKSGGSGADVKEKSDDKEEKEKLLNDNSKEKYPLSSKIYELINKGYMHETQPW